MANPPGTVYVQGCKYVPLSSEQAVYVYNFLAVFTERQLQTKSLHRNICAGIF
jgi:hypothetical protein